MVMQFPFLGGRGGGGEAAGLRVNNVHYGLCENGVLSIFAAYLALQIISLFCGICQYGLGSFSIEKKIYTFVSMEMTAGYINVLHQP